MTHPTSAPATTSNHTLLAVLLMHGLSLEELRDQSRPYRRQALADAVGMLVDHGQHSPFAAARELGVEVALAEFSYSIWRRRPKVAREAIRWAVSRFETSPPSSLCMVPRRDRAAESAAAQRRLEVMA